MGVLLSGGQEGGGGGGVGLADFGLRGCEMEGVEGREGGRERGR